MGITPTMTTATIVSSFTLFCVIATNVFLGGEYGHYARDCSLR